VSASHFNAKGKTAGDTTFKITLTGCGEAGTKIRANFQKGVMVDTSSGRLNINRADTHSAQNIQIELASPATDAPVVIGTDQQTTTYFPVDKNGNVEMTYVARYYATGKVAPGHVNSQVTYVLQYQ
jgi:major type 1 subunit fimbrin (pilin)